VDAEPTALEPVALEDAAAETVAAVVRDLVLGLLRCARAQKRAIGGCSLSWLGLKEGQGPQNFLQISMFSRVSGTISGILEPTGNI